MFSSIRMSFCYVKSKQHFGISSCCHILLSIAFMQGRLLFLLMQQINFFNAVILCRCILFSNNIYKNFIEN